MEMESDIGEFQKDLLNAQESLRDEKVQSSDTDNNNEQTKTLKYMIQKVTRKLGRDEEIERNGKRTSNIWSLIIKTSFQQSINKG